jgi:hypothetical protein
MARMKKVIAFPCGLFFGVVAPLHLEELDSLPLRDTIFLIQYLERMLWI